MSGVKTEASRLQTVHGSLGSGFASGLARISPLNDDSTWLVLGLHSIKVYCPPSVLAAGFPSAHLCVTGAYGQWVLEGASLVQPENYVLVLC